MIATNDRIGQLVDDLSQHQAERAQIDDLVSRIDAMAGHVAPASAEEVEAEAMGDGEGEAFEDEYDDELFGIFVDQLREGLQALLDETGKLLSGEPADAALGRYEDRLSTLSSSANYMGYDKLKQIYAQWSQSVAEWTAGLAAGEARDWDRFAQEVNAANIERVKGFFPKVKAIQEMVLQDRTPTPVTVDQEAAEQPMAESADEPTALPTQFDDSLLGDFIEEAGEHLDEIEHNLLLLAEQPNSVEVLNELFRSVHTIKGSSEYLGMLRIAELSHKLETLLDLLRQEKIEANREIIDILMGGRDRINLLVQQIADSQIEQASIEDLLSRIDRLSEPTPDELSTSASAQPEKTKDTKAPTSYEETYDQELFAIFLSQLKEGLAEVSRTSENLKSSSEVEADLDRCKDKLLRLRSSANYMEYDELKAIYEQWIAALDELTRQINAGNQTDLGAWVESVMVSNLDLVRSQFNLPKEVISIDAVEEMEAVAEEEAASESLPVDSTEPVASDSSYASPEDAAETDETESPLISTIETYEEEIIDDQSLLSRLENAFDARFETHVNTDFTVDSELDVVKELFSDEESSDAALDFSKAFKTQYSEPPDEAKPPEGDTIEALLFSDDSIIKPPRGPMPPKPLVPAIESAEQRLQEPLLADDEHRVPATLGRRQTDKFRERLLKQSIRVDAGKIDTLMNQVGELVVTRAGFNQLFLEMRELQLMFKQAQKLDTRESQLIKDLTNRINEATVSLGRVTSELQENVMKVRMLPIAQLFSRYPRVVYDLVRNTNKKVELDIRGEETELDRMVIEQISDPLIHIIRNAVDHGIEPMDERQRKGKSETGTLRLEAYHEGNYVVIEVSDDGRGIDAALVRSKALSKGFIDPEALENMSEDEVVALITQPGFSTADEVTHTSGRGVGMDVVKDNIEKLNGTLEIEGRPGRGALFRIKIPLTLAIIQALMVRVCGEIFTIPLTSVDETIRIHQNEISRIEGMEIYYLRETTLPLIRLPKLFKMQHEAEETEDLFVVVVNTGARQVGLVVDQLKGREEVVIKPLEDYLQEKSGFSGATILGDGNISLILDVSDLVHIAIDQHTRRLKAAAL